MEASLSNKRAELYFQIDRSRRLKVLELFFNVILNLRLFLLLNLNEQHQRIQVYGESLSQMRQVDDEQWT